MHEQERVYCLLYIVDSRKYLGALYSLMEPSLKVYELGKQYTRFWWNPGLTTRCYSRVRSLDPGLSLVLRVLSGTHHAPLGVRTSGSFFQWLGAALLHSR